MPPLLQEADELGETECLLHRLHRPISDRAATPQVSGQDWQISGTGSVAAQVPLVPTGVQLG